MSANALARELRVPPNRITAIVNETRAMSADTALRLARYFGTTPEFLDQPAGRPRPVPGPGRVGPRDRARRAAPGGVGRETRHSQTTRTLGHFPGQFFDSNRAR